MLAASIIRAMMVLMMEKASTSESSVNFYQATRSNIPEDSHRHFFYSTNFIQSSTEKGNTFEIQ
jgi:hypothetical protein